MAEAPSVRISIRSMPAMGNVLMSKPALAPVISCPAKIARRRPLSSTSVRCSPMLWIETPANPLPPPPTEADSGVPPCVVGSFCSRSVIEVAAILRIWSRVMIWTGSAPSVSIRGTEEPVI